MNRWTKKARLNVPPHMAGYNKENPELLSLTYRHNSLMIKALQFVQMGDSNVESHKMAMEMLDANMNALADVSKEKDGKGLADRELHEQDCPTGDDGFLDNFPQRVPMKRQERGRQTNKRDKPAYEGSKRPRLCSVCRKGNHNKLKCPDWDPVLNVRRKPPTCSGCGLEGHTIDRCGRNVQQAVQFALVSNLLV
jgi:hypothetical protein